jgi:hypothetical protein
LRIDAESAIQIFEGTDKESSEKLETKGSGSKSRSKSLK